MAIAARATKNLMVGDSCPALLFNPLPHPFSTGIVILSNIRTSLFGYRL